MKRPVLTLLAAAVLAGVTLAACGSSGSTGTTPAPASTRPAATATAAPGSSASTAGATITIKGYAYTLPASVGSGERISVRNEDDVAHTVTVDAGSDFDVTVPASGTATFAAPSKPGSYPFHCTYHANMHGTLTVQ